MVQHGYLIGNVKRDIDVVFLGGFTDRRAAALARLGPVLWDRQTQSIVTNESSDIARDFDVLWSREPEWEREQS